MMIQVPWKKGLRRGRRVSSRSSRWWNRRGHHAGSRIETSRNFLHEDDLDHLGTLHRRR